MLKNDEVDYCTKCTVKPIVKEHMCEECYESHNEWLRELSAPKQDDDQWFTLYESKVLQPTHGLFCYSTQHLILSVQESSFY